MRATKGANLIYGTFVELCMQWLGNMLSFNCARSTIELAALGHKSSLSRQKG